VTRALGDPERLAALERSGLLESGREEAFDRWTRLARQLLGVPVSLVSLVDDHRQIFKGAAGLELTETPLSHSFCQHVARDQRPLIVTDARADLRVSANLAVRDLDVIAYLGVPLTTTDGQTLGSFCAIDSAPRTWSPSDVELLGELSRGVMAEIELRASNRQLARLALELQEAEAAAHRERDYSTAITASMREGFLLTRRGVIVEVNAAFCALTGFERKSLIGAQHPYPFWAAASLEELQAHRVAIESGDSPELRTTYRRRDGTLVRVSINTVIARSGGGEPIGYVSTIRDIAGLERREARLEHDASRDGLTGLLNRRVFDAQLWTEIAQAERHGRPLSIAMLDLDLFKQINDRHGHPVGDDVLREVTRRFAGVVRDGEYLARIGGEEFGWILPEATAADAHIAAERARRAVGEAPFPPAGSLTISAGVCQFAAGRDDVESLYRHADEALYAAKRAGRNRTVIWQSSPDQNLDAQAGQGSGPAHPRAGSAD
jgi:diguanylate cyclase (GGDEF)-like protein/PAS domain S-box-containing protein